MARFRAIVRAGVAALLIFDLSACSYVIRVRAAFIDGHFGFVLAEGQPSQGSRCLYRFVLSIETGETVWELERPESRLDGCDPWLPLFYGSAPSGVRTLVSAHRLEMEAVYVIRGDAFGSVEGAFVLHRAGGRIVVENIDPHGRRAGAVAATASDWQQEQSRRASENALRPEHENGVPFEDRPLPPERH